MGNGAPAISGQAIRYQDDIDVYITHPDKKLIHYLTNPRVEWKYGWEQLGWDVISRPSAIRYQGAIDVYYINEKKELIHYYVGENNGWNNQWECLDHDLFASVDPVSFRYHNDTSVYYFKQSGQLVHMYSSERTGWKYDKQVLATGGGQSLFALRVLRNAIDIYFAKDGKIYHITNGDHTGWNYSHPFLIKNIPTIKKGSKIKAIREANDIDIFYLDNNNKICQLIFNERNKWQYQSRYLQFQGPDTGQFQVLRNGAHIDLYFIRNFQVHHTYSGIFNFFQWKWPSIISESDAAYGLCGVRTKLAAIDIYYINKAGQFRNMYIGQGTKFDWSKYQYGKDKLFEFRKPQKQPQKQSQKIDQRKPQRTPQKQVYKHRKSISWQELIEKHACLSLGDGCNSNTFKTTIDGKDWVVKKYKKPSLQIIRREMNALDRIDKINPGILLCELIQGGKLAGIIMKMFSGKTIGKVQEQKKLSTDEKIQIVISFAREVEKIQSAGICHSDLHLNNLIITQQKHGIYRVNIIDYGNCFIFDKSTRTKFDLRGSDFMKPPQYFEGAYCPIGVNAFQFARVAISIFAGTAYEEFGYLKNSQQELEKIRKQDRAAYYFLKPVIKLLQIKDPFMRIIDPQFLEQLQFCK